MSKVSKRTNLYVKNGMLDSYTFLHPEQFADTKYVSFPAGSLYCRCFLLFFHLLLILFIVTPRRIVDAQLYME